MEVYVFGFGRYSSAQTNMFAIFDYVVTRDSIGPLKYLRRSLSDTAVK